MKKRVGIIYSGQLRSNGLNPEYKSDDIILEATRKYFLNDHFSEKYDYDVFFSVDTIDVSKAKEFFGDHLKNIHITETEWYMNEVDTKIPDYSYYNSKFLSNDFQNCDTFEHSLYQYYRMYCGYNMLKDYQTKNNIKYDYLVRIRPDIRIMQDLMPLFAILETTNKQIIMEHEQLCILTPYLEEMFAFVNYMGTYKGSLWDHMQRYTFLSRDGLGYPDKIWKFAPEKQFVDYVYDFVSKKQLDYFEVLLGITYPSFNLLYRGNNEYAYIDNNHPIYHDPNYIWIPFTKL
jgi:hypothetical protein